MSNIDNSNLDSKTRLLKQKENEILNHLNNVQKKESVKKKSIHNEETHYLNSDLDSFINSSEYAEDIYNIEKNSINDNLNNNVNLLLMAKEEEIHNKYEDSLKIYNNILEKEPNCLIFDVYKGKVSSLSYLKKYDEAFDFIEKIVKNKFSNREILLLKSEVYYIKEEYNNSLKCINNILEIKNKDEEILSFKLKILYHLKDTNMNELINCLNKLYKINQDNPDALYYFGKLSQDAEKYEEAIKYYLKAIDQIKEVEIYENLGICYQHINKYKEALIYYEKYSIYHPKEINFYNMGVCSFILKLFNKSNEYFTMCSELNPKNYLSLNYKGLSCLKLGNEKKAECQFHKVIQINPFFYEAYINLININLDKYKYEDALNIIKKARNNLKKDENYDDVKNQFLNELDKYEIKIKLEKEDDKKNQCSCQGCLIF